MSVGNRLTTPSSDRPLPAIYGWSEPESEYTIRVSKGGGCVFSPHMILVLLCLCIHVSFCCLRLCVHYGNILCTNSRTSSRVVHLSTRASYSHPFDSIPTRYVLCSGAPNLSFWARLAASSLAGAFGSVARAAAPSSAPLRNKVYVTFQTNEGDTPKIVAGLFGGSWLNPNRGRVPIAWGINLYV